MPPITLTPKTTYISAAAAVALLLAVASGVAGAMRYVHADEVADLQMRYEQTQTTEAVKLELLEVVAGVGEDVDSIQRQVDVNGAGIELIREQMVRNTADRFTMRQAIEAFREGARINPGTRWPRPGDPDRHFVYPPNSEDQP